jgi:3-keto-5-aminohexanoate cleavage enzyme
MTTPCIIAVAITGSLPTKRNNPAVPIEIQEQIDSTQEAFEAGATLAHCHVRNDDGTPTSSPERFARLMEGLRKHCPGIIIQLSTGGRSGAGRERGGMIALKPDMASLATGSCNFPTRVYENSPELIDWLATELLEHGVKPEIEAFDLSMIFKAVEMEKAGQIKGPLHVQFVMGVKNAMPVDREVFEFYIKTLKRLAPDATWTGAGIGKDQITPTAGHWNSAAIAAPDLRTMFESTATRSHCLMPRSSNASLTYATNMDEGLPPCTRREHDSVSLYRMDQRCL